MTTRLLHGTLEAHIFEAAHLPNLAGCASCTPRFFGKLFQGHGEESSDKRDLFSKINRFFCCPQEVSKDVSEGVVGSTGLYATIDLGKTRVARTRLIKNEAVRPLWNEFFHVYCAHMISDIVFTVKKDHLIDATLIGRAHLPVEDVIRGTTVDRWLQLLDEGGQPIRRNAKIHVKLQFLNFSQDLERSLWIRSPNFDGVPYTYFKQREGCRVSLYQDAHIPDNIIPRIPLSGGNYESHRCWEDVFDAITNARHLIYITGWSVYTEISLVRDPRRPKQGGNTSLGELLKRKAREGVRVLMLVWDDRTSVPSLKKDGLMATHDQDTAGYFQNTEVHCVLCPREPGGGSSVVQGLQIYTMFTHHQKTLVVDSEVTIAGSQRRMILSFVGGIDLCDGRYDTPVHSLFRTLNTTHSHDFHQPNFTGASINKGGPREPWHDIHCKLEGPIAWDVLFNFEQRWNKQGMKGLLVNINSAGIISPTNTAFFPRDSESWNVQLFRSIDVGAATGFPLDPDKMARAGLVTGKDNIIERSIQDAYINAIRQAKNFIYIENQYFLGSSFGWKPDGIDAEEIGALHLIPKELSLKIVSKIKANERFTVYIVIPMWPEGIPESSSVQAILNWQKKTMEMMYTDITQALQASGLQADPKDYLSFFCLGNREVKKSGEYVPTEHPEPDTDYARAQETRRFMIYVHAKMMIVDDEYIIIGSANINQRSMDGARDTEIAMAAYQPSHLNGEEAAKGQIHGFRMALWFEHLGTYNNSYLRPESLDCVRIINNFASENWRRYSSDAVQEDLPGHLLSYPISVNSNGTVTELGPGTFPDTKAHILGSKTDLPPILTT